MSDVIVTVVESNTNVTVTEQDVAVAITETNVDVSASSAGIQGATGATGVGYSGVTSTSTITIGSGLKTFTLVSGNQGAFVTGMRIRAIHSDTPTYYMEGTANYVGGGTIIITVDKFNGSGSHNLWNFAVSGEVGQTGATGSSGVVSVTSPITNTGTSGSAIVGIDQTLLSITRSQVSDFTSGTVTYATTSGTSVSISGTVAQSQVTSLVTDLANRAKLDTANTFTVGGHVISNAATAVIPLVLKGASGQSGDYLQVQTSAGGIVAKMTSSANPRFILGTSDTSSTFGVSSHAAGGVVAVVRGAASQSANLLEIQNSAGGTTVAVNNSNSIQFGPSLQSFLSGTNGRILIVNTSATAVPLTVQGAASQSANLQSWQNSGGTTIASVDSAGNVRGLSVRSNSDYTSLLEANSGGYLRLTRQTAATPNPGANLGSLYFRDGTTVGTLKLVVRAGAAGAETTILDNIPQ